MKKIALFAVLLLALANMVHGFGVGDDLSPDELSMSETDTETTQYCVSGVVPPDAVFDVVVDPVCLDTNGLSGCQGTDVLDPAEFSAEPASDQINLAGGEGCVDIELETTGAGGIYYYTVNGKLGGAKVSAETGMVLVPEFTAVAGLAALGIAGLYIHKKRKN